MNSDWLIIGIIALIAISIFIIGKKNIEGFSTGALIQLMAKGPQDRYLSADAEKYIYYPFHGEFLWNNSTRLKGLYYPYYTYQPRYNYYPTYPLHPYNHYNNLYYWGY